MKTNLLLVLAAISTYTNISAQTFPVTNIYVHGRQNNRINIAVLPDGYTQAQLSTFIQNADTVMAGAFNTTPYKEYKNFYNVFAIEVPSAESGTKHPGTATDVPEPISPITTANTYFNTTFDYGNIHRLLVANNTSAINTVLAANLPSYDQALVLVNSTVYGGSGGPSSVASMHPLSIEITEHEWGHTFAGLADEYYSGLFGEHPNLTAQSNLSLIKWHNWVGVNGVGAQFASVGWYKPTNTCKMNAVDVPFCPVCAEALVDFVYHAVSPIDSTSPSTATAVNYPGSPLQFTVNVVKPEPYTLKVNWTLNGVAITGADTTITLAATQLNNGANMLKAFVTDTTSLSRSYWPAAGYQFSATWTINKTNTGIFQVTNQGDHNKFFYKLYPIPATDNITLAYENRTPDKHAVYSIMDVNGRVVRGGTLQLSSGQQTTQIAVNDLAAGNYIFTVRGNNIHVDAKFIKQ